MRNMITKLRKLSSITLLAGGLLCMFPSVLWAAETKVTLQGDFKYLKGQSTWNYEDAPVIKFTMKELRVYAGKTEKFTLKLENARWFEGRGTTLVADNRNGVAVEAIRIFAATDNEAQVEVDIPSGIEDDQEISFTIALPLTTSDNVDEVGIIIEPIGYGENTKFTERTTVTLGSSNEKKLKWEVEKVPTIGYRGEMADFIITETKAASLGTRTTDIYLTIQNRDFCFSEPSYSEKETYSDNARYILEDERYITFEGGFSNSEAEIIETYISKDKRQMIIRFSGDVATQPGVIRLKNLPIVRSVEETDETEVIVLVQGENITHSNEKVTVAYYDESLAQKQNAEQQGQTEVVKKPEPEKEEATTTDQNKSIIKFKVGEKIYTINGQSHHMDAQTVILPTGYTMVPIRYVAESLGAKDIQYNSGKVSFVFEGKIIQIDTKYNKARMNGEEVVLKGKVQVINNRVYGPIGEIASLLQVEKTWDNEEQSATFYY